LGKPVAKVWAVNELHDQIYPRRLRLRHIGAGVKQGDQAVVVQPRKDLDFILVATQIIGSHQWWLNELYGDIAAQELISGTVNGPYRTAPDLLKEAISAAEKNTSGTVDCNLRHLHSALSKYNREYNPVAATQFRRGL